MTIKVSDAFIFLMCNYLDIVLVQLSSSRAKEKYSYELSQCRKE